jgi:hypothetical protein
MTAMCCPCVGADSSNSIRRGRNIARPETGGLNLVEMSSAAGDSPGNSADFNMGRPRTVEGDRAPLRNHGN